MDSRPFSQACENNKQPILAILRTAFKDMQRVLEIGSGTGQHAVFFAEKMPHLFWQCADVKAHHEGIDAWITSANLPNIGHPLDLDVNGTWPADKYDGVFSANTLHIMGWPEVELFFSGVDSVLAADGVLVIYGPFNYDGRYTSDSNAQFDQWLAARDAKSAIRDFAAVNALAKAIGLELMEDNAMPANNRCLVWRRSGNS